MTAQWDDSRWPSTKGAGQVLVRLPSLSATALAEEEEWRHHAACAGQETDLFFPAGTGREAMAQTDVAKEICHGCSARAECLRFALDTGQDTGVWGGLSEAERRALPASTA